MDPTDPTRAGPQLFHGCCNAVSRPAGVKTIIFYFSLGAVDLAPTVAANPAGST